MRLPNSYDHKCSHNEKYSPRGRYGENGEIAPMPEDMRNAKMDQAMTKSLLRKRANLAFYTAQAETSHTADAEPVPPNLVSRSYMLRDTPVSKQC